MSMVRLFFGRFLMTTSNSQIWVNWSICDFDIAQDLLALFFENFFGGCSVLSVKSCTSIVALNYSRAASVGSGGSAGLVRDVSGLSTGIWSGAGNLEPLVPCACGGEWCSGFFPLSISCRFAQLSHSTKAWLPVHLVFMHLCFPLSHYPPGPALDLQFPKLNA